MEAPKAFISYSHDSAQHKKWVLDLAVRLRNFGVDAALDQWDLGPGGDLPHFMEKHLREADHVLMVCTDQYVKKANDGTGGVGYEKMIVTADLMKGIDSKKVIPLIRQRGSRDVPVFLASKLYLDFSLPNQFEFGFDELVRTIHKAPLLVKPKLGINPFAAEPLAAPPAAMPTGNSRLLLMKAVVADYEGHSRPYVHYPDLVASVPMSRVLLDYAIDQAVDDGLLEQDPDGSVLLTAKGKQYALQEEIASSRNRAKHQERY